MRDYTDITVVLDRSGSMEHIREGTIQGFNDFVREQQTVPGDGCWSLVQFDDQYEVVYAQLPQGQVPLLTAATFVPRGSTALVDAVCRTIEEAGTRLRTLPEQLRPGRVLVVILTDGLENASTRYQAADLHRMVSHQRDKYNWQFIYLGANQDAIAEAARYGIPKAASATYAFSNTGSANALCAASAGTRAWKVEGNDTAAGLVIDPSTVDSPKGV